MPFTFNRPERISFEEANPMLAGAKYGMGLVGQGQDIYSKMLANQIAQTQAQYAQPMAQQELQRAKLYNQFYGPNIQSEIGLRGAQAGKLGEETKYYGKEAQARIAEQQALAGYHGSEAQMNAMKLNYMKQLLSPQKQEQVQGQPQGQPQGQSQPSESVYGIETPKPTHEDIVNKMILGTDTYSPKMQNAKIQQQDQYKQYQKEMESSVQEANAANDLNQAVSIFNNAMDSSFYKGSKLGGAPSSGWKTMFMGNVSAEQQADRSAMQMLPSAIGTLKNAMGSARFSNLDMNMASKLKFDRTMDDDTRKTQTAWVNAANDRMKERAKFYQVMGNPQSGASKAQADMLFQEYQNNFPLINKQGNKVMRENLGNWPLYTTPKALDSIQKTGSYIPTASERNTFMMKYPDGVIRPVKKGGVESAIRKGATPA